MNCARNCGNLLNFVKVIPKTLLVPFFSGHGVVSKIFNLCGADAPKSQTDRWTDDMRLQDHALHYRASCGKNLGMMKQKVTNNTCNSEINAYLL